MKDSSDSYKPPAFQVYAKDWITDRIIQFMTPAEEGALFRLLCNAWLDDQCRLPDCDKELAVLSRFSARKWKQSGAKIRSYFENDGDFLFCVWQREYRKMLKDRFDDAVKSGRKGGKAPRRPQGSLKRASSEPSLENQGSLKEALSSSSSLSLSSSEDKSTSNHKNDSHPLGEDAGGAQLAPQPEAKKTKKPNPVKPPPSVMASEFMAVWNANCGKLPKCFGMPVKRTTHITARLQSQTLLAAGLLTPADYAPIIQWFAADDFYSGKNDRGWTASIDYLIRSDEQPLKVLELIQGGRRRPRDAFNGQLLNGPMDYSEPKKSPEELAAIHAAAEAGDELPY